MEGFPKSQRFILGARVSDAALAVLELLGQAAYAAKGEKLSLLETAVLRINGLRWLLRMCKDRNLFSNRQYGHASMQ